MQRLSTAYMVYFNLRHGRHGYGPVWVAGWVRRPIKERIARLRSYRWSSHAGYAGLGRQWNCVDEGPVLEMMSGRRSQKRKSYRGFVESGLAEGDEEFREALKAAGLAVGDEVFRQWVEQLRAKALTGRRVKQDVSFRRVMEPLPAALVIEEVTTAFGVKREMLRVTRKESPVRAVAARFLVRYAGQTQREVASWLGVGTGTAVGSQLQRLEQWEKANRKLRSIIQRVERSLEAKRQALGTLRKTKKPKKE